MSMETHSTLRKRVYKRKFDHDLAREMYAKGFTIAAIHRLLGRPVTQVAIARVVNPKVNKRMRAQSVKFAMTGECVQCGGPCHRYSSRDNDNGLCRKCSAKAKRTRFQYDADGEISAVRCHRCRQWRHPLLFARSKKMSLGIGNTCRPCATAIRQDYRERHKVPCLFCGKPCLPPGEKGARTADYPRCRECFFAGKMLLTPLS